MDHLIKADSLKTFGLLLLAGVAAAFVMYILDFAIQPIEQAVTGATTRAA